MKTIFDELAEKTGFTDLGTDKRDANRASARQAVMFRLKEKGYHENEIAKMCNRCRSDILYNLKKFESLLDVNDRLSIYYYSIIKDI